MFFFQLCMFTSTGRSTHIKFLTIECISIIYNIIFPNQNSLITGKAKAPYLLKRINLPLM